MSLGQSKGGLPPDDCVEDEEFILRDSERVIQTYHDDSPGSMTQIVLAPCSPFSVTVSLLRDSAALARQYKVKLHTHLCETRDEERYTLERFQLRPVDWMETHGWLGEDVWFAHAIHVDDDEIKKFAQTGCGAAHCPCSNMRLGFDDGLHVQGGNSLSVALTSFFTMPWFVRAFGWWLFPEKGSNKRLTIKGLAIMGVLYAAEIVILWRLLSW